MRIPGARRAVPALAARRLSARRAVRAPLPGSFGRAQVGHRPAPGLRLRVRVWAARRRTWVGRPPAEAAQAAVAGPAVAAGGAAAAVARAVIARPAAVALRSAACRFVAAARNSATTVAADSDFAAGVDSGSVASS